MSESSTGSVGAVAPPPPPVTDEVVPPLRNYLVLIIAMVLFVELNAMVIQMSVPALRLMAPHFPVAGLAWVITLVSLVGAMVQPLGGKLADRLGLRQMIAAVAVLFLVGSVICALTTDFTVLLIGRALEAAVLVMPAVAYRVYRDSLPARYVPIALGTLGTGIGVASLIGPIIAGALIDAFGYRALFWFFVIYIVVVAPLVYFTLPKSVQRRTAQRIDFVGGLMIGLGIGGLLLGLSEGATWGWTAFPTLASIIVGIVLLGLFPVVERRQRQPMIDVSLLTRPAVVMTLLIGFLGMVPVIGFAFALPQMMQTPKTAGLGYAFGMSALAVGLVQIPYGVFAMVFGPLGGAVTRRIPVRTVMIASLALITLGLLLLGFFHTDLWAIVGWIALIGLGVGCYWAAQPNLMVEAVPAEYTGVSGGIQLCVQATAASATSALVGAIIADHVIGVTAGQPLYSDSAFSLIYFVSAAAGALAIVLTLFMKHGRRPATGGLATGH